MNYAAGLVTLGIVVVLYILYRVTQKAFNVVFGLMCAHAYLLLVDRVYPDVSLLRIMYSPPQCSNRTSLTPLLPITLEPPITLAEFSDKINEQVPSEWKSWIPSFLSTVVTTPETEPTIPDTASTHKSEPKPKLSASSNVIDRDKQEFEAFQRWKASQKDL